MQELIIKCFVTGGQINETMAQTNPCGNVGIYHTML